MADILHVEIIERGQAMWVLFDNGYIEAWEQDGRAPNGEATWRRVTEPSDEWMLRFRREALTWVIKKWQRATSVISAMVASAEPEHQLVELHAWLHAMEEKDYPAPGFRLVMRDT